MEQFIKHFVREGNGRWYCFQACTLNSPVGRIQVNEGTTFVIGTKFMNFDIAEALEVEHAKQAAGHPD